MRATRSLVFALTWATVLPLVMTGCEPTAPSESTGNHDAKAQSLREVVAQELQPPRFTLWEEGIVVVAFKRGTDRPVKSYSEDIQRSVRVPETVRLSRVHVALWPDNGRGETAEDLTEARYAVLRDTLRTEIPGLETVTYDMADRANWMERLLGMDEQQVKDRMKALEAGKAENENADDVALVWNLARQFQRRGGPGKAVIVPEVRHARASE